ncbi:RHS repeat-associated core domain-containing protein [Streptomyces shenzhenensis]|uniref:RHS repeat-associated core domain-containing protein n=1 Tax=Streptomyces shenzhenensis TaxID=943815 RepID=UPI0033FBFC7E
MLLSLAIAAEAATVALTTGQAFAIERRQAASGVAVQTPSSWGLSPSSVNAYSGDRFTTRGTPTLWAKAVGSNGGTYKAEFELTADPAAGDTTYSYTGMSASTASGVNALLSVPSDKALPDGKHLRLRVRAYDGTAYSSWTGYSAFAVDTTLPAAPAVSCAGYTEGDWNAPLPNGATCTFTTSAADGQGYVWGLDDPNTPERLDDETTGTGGATKSVTVTANGGWHTLYVRTVDKAGNHSAKATAYSFGVGSDGVALTSPGDGQRSARRVPLAAIGKSTYTNAVYEYRRGEADTWKTIPASDVTIASNGVTATWPIPVTDGKSTALVWKATDTLSEDGPIEVRAKLSNATASGYSQTVTVTVDRVAGNAPTEEIGPGSVNLLTGDYALPARDLSLFGLTISRTASSRRPDAGAQQEGQVPIFGPEWVSGLVAEKSGSSWKYLEQTSDTTVSVVDADGNATGFVATSDGGWQPETGSESLALTGSPTSSFTLSETDGTVTAFAKADSSAAAWNVTTISLPSSGSATTTVLETVTSGSATLSRPKYLIAPTSAVSATTCKATPSTQGCRILEFVYATSTTATSSALGDYTGRVSQIKLWATAPSGTASTATTVVKYLYDISGRLRESWDARLSTPLKTAYAYDSSGRVTTLTPPGELPWTIEYGKAGSSATAGAGMLLSVSRPTLTPGTKSTVNGAAKTSLVYDLPVSGNGAPYAMSVGDTQAWGQRQGPTDATAIFPADQVPASHDGGSLASGDYKRATVTYLDESGREVNTAEPGGHIGTIQYDRFGNIVRELTPANRSLALGLTTADDRMLAELGISGLDSAQRADLLSSYNYYNENGLRLLEEFGPLHRVELTKDFKSGDKVLLPAGSTVSARSWKVNEYDKGRPTDGSAKVKDQLTIVTAGLRVDGYDSLLADKRGTVTQYDWVTGLPTLVTEDAGGLALNTNWGYDAQGRVTGVILPGGNGNDASSKVFSYWKATGTGFCQGHPEWEGLLCWTGPAGDITGGGSNPTTSVDSTITYDLFGQPLKTVDTSGDSHRTTTRTYDAVGRLLTSRVTGNLGQSVPGITNTYDPDTGRLMTTTSADGGTITRDYDNLGRIVSYADADGGATTTEYDALNRPVKNTDTAPSTTSYTYDTASDPRGLVTKLTDSVAGSFTAAYDADGSLTNEKLPGGYTLDQTSDPTGALTKRTYTRDSDGTAVFAESVVRSVHEQVTSRSSNTAGTQHYTYDGAGRLNTVEDSDTDGVCTTRNYTLDKRANRVAQATASGAAGTGCQASGSSTTHSYDSGDRLVDPGYVYDDFGRTTSLPGSTVDYYMTDLTHRQTTGAKRQTWTLDSAYRFRSWTEESESSGTWSTTATKVNHYADDDDSPRWITEDTGSGSVTRNIAGIEGGLAATTSKSGDVKLQFINVHGDVSVVQPLDAGATATLLKTDEYGNITAGTVDRYGWLGSYQRSAQALSGVILMGARLYNTSTGRFLSTDPVFGGSSNAYEYCSGDPVNCLDLDGRWSISRTRYYSWGNVSAKAWSTSSWGLPKINAQYEFRFNRSYTAKLGRSAHWYWGPFWTAVGLLGPAGTGVALVGAAWSGFFQKAAAKAASKKKCITLGAGISIYPVGAYGGPYWRTRSC